jgi:AraC-like DNA-binding protein
MTLSHMARELGYAEQSVLTRACRRWFGSTPAVLRQELR